MTYVEQINPPYINDRLRAQRIRNDFELDPLLQENRDRIILIGGANLVLRGIIEFTPDIDILAPAALLQEMQGRDGAETMKPPFYARVNGADNFNVRFETDPQKSWVTATDRLGDGHYPMSYHGLDIDNSSTQMIFGVRCLALERIKASKMALRRRKDIEHLKAIARYPISSDWGWEEPL